ncbi:MAG: hypothetical protein M0P61_12365 [Ignavibacteriaceae bacterium]|jgi:hypothetical protein|nr:hypothetical protein [Ignavibacteriaceae bacterium]
MKKYTFAILFVIVLATTLKCQYVEKYEHKTNFNLNNERSINNFFANENDSLRKIYYSIGMGLSEFAQIGVGYQIDRKYDLTLKYGITWTSYGAGFHVPGSGAGWGITASYFNDFWIFNKVSIEYLYYTTLPLHYDPSDNMLKKNYGNYYQIDIGKEYIFKSKNLQFYWLIGVGISCPQKQGTLVLPTIGIGFTKNN